MFGPAAGEMKRFFEGIEGKWVDEMMAKTALGPVGPITIMPGYYETWARIYSPEVLAGYARLLDAAAAAVKPGSLEARRIAMFRGEMLDPLVATAKEAHDSFDVAKCLERRKAQTFRRIVFEDDGRDLSKWKPVPVKAEAPARAGERGPVSAAPMMVASRSKDVQKVRLKVDLKPNAKYRLSYFLKLEDVKISETWSRFSCRLTFEGAPRVGRGAPRFVETTGWIYVVREYETPANLNSDSCAVECTFLDAVGSALIDGLRVEELSD